MDTSDSPRRPIDIKALTALVKPYWARLSVATVALFVGTGMTLVYPTLVGTLVDDALSDEGSYGNLNGIILILIGVFAVQSIFGFVRSYLFTVVGERVVADLRQQLYSALVYQDIGFFDERRTGELTNRLASDTTVLQNTVTANISMALRFSLQAIGGIAILIYTSPKLTAVMLAVVPVVAISAALYGRSIRSLSKGVQDALAGASDIAEETLSGIRTVRSFGGEGR